MTAKHAADVNPGKQGSSIAPCAPVSFADWGKRGRGTRTVSPLYPGRRALSAPLALGWYVSRFQRFCRFAARETGAFDSARSSMAQFSMGDRLPVAGPSGRLTRPIFLTRRREGANL